MDVRNSGNSNGISINSGAIGGNRPRATAQGGRNGKNLRPSKANLLERLDAIDKRYSYNHSLTDLFNQMDANAIR